MAAQVVTVHTQFQVRLSEAEAAKSGLEASVQKLHQDLGQFSEAHANSMQAGSNTAEKLQEAERLIAELEDRLASAINSAAQMQGALAATNAELATKTTALQVLFCPQHFLMSCFCPSERSLQSCSQTSLQ